MRQAIGAVLVLIGVAPVLAILVAVLWTWSRHMYTVGLSVDVRGMIVLPLIAAADIGCLFVGAFLLRKPRGS